ncbi:MAG: hypothetical protein SNG02_04745 [Rikenellaceae bacterium]
MRNFDLEKIGKKMPYEAPSEKFFENFKSDVLERVEREKSVPQPTTKKFTLATTMRLFVPLVTAAASLLIGLFVFDRMDYSSSAEDMSYLISDNLDASLDSYFNSLSDDDLAYLLDNTSSQDDFYLTLPENE